MFKNFAYVCKSLNIIMQSLLLRLKYITNINGLERRKLFMVQVKTDYSSILEVSTIKSMVHLPYYSAIRQGSPL